MYHTKNYEAYTWNNAPQRHSFALRVYVIVYAVLLAFATVLYWLVGLTIAFAGTTGVGPLDWQIKRWIELAVCAVIVATLGYGGFRRWSFGRIGTLTCLLLIVWAWWYYIFVIA